MTIRLILTHGAGAGMNSEFMRALASAFEALDVEVKPFNFSYMQMMIETGKRRPPSKLPVLEQELLSFVNEQDTAVPLFVAGKSMGGRVATRILERSRALGALCFGYPFHPIHKPERLRTEHLANISKFVHIFQGTRDQFGVPDEVQDYDLSEHVSVNWLEGADHDFKGGGISSLQRIESAAKLAVHLIQRQL